MYEWFRDIRGFPNYNVSDHGNVMNVCTGDILKKRPTAYGLQVRLFNDHGRKPILVARLVADSFLRELDPRLVVEHIDGNQYNDLATNLRIVAPIGVYISRRDKTPRNNHKSIPVRIVDTGREFPNMRAMAKHLHCTHQSISRALREEPHILNGQTIELVKA